jgi:hypothetical protein
MKNWQTASASAPAQVSRDSLIWDDEGKGYQSDASEILVDDINSAPDCGAEADGKSRLVWRFSWDAVKPPLIRDLLAAAYHANEQSGDAEKLRGLTDEGLRQNAVRVLGRPLDVRHTDAVVDVLRDGWLPTVRSETLGLFVDAVQLGLSGADRIVSHSTKAERLAFLLSRRRTRNFKLQLRKFLLREHRVLAPPETQSVGQRPPRFVGPIELRGGRISGSSDTVRLPKGGMASADDSRGRCG